MEASINKYRQAIQTNKINPMAHWDGKESKIIFDPKDPNTPLECMGLGAIVLSENPFEIKTGEYEYVLIPIKGRFEVSVAGKTFSGSRPGGPFQTQPELSNASAIYIGKDTRFSVIGSGQMIYFFATAFGEKDPVFVKPGEKRQLRRGEGIWHREVITLITTDDISTNLVVGETYSPPGLWSGTPLHVHDKDDLEGGQSDMEEIYFHLAREIEGSWGPYGVQLLFDNKGLDKAYMIHNNDAIAIPGGAHPVVAGPAADMLYVWALASNKTTELKMKDIEEFTYLKEIEKIIAMFEAKRGKFRISKEELAQLADESKLTNLQRQILKMHLMERGFDIV